MRVIAGFESAFGWNCGADKTAGPETPLQEETGAWQVSANSMALDPSLRAFVIAELGTDHPATFITACKSNHRFVVHYVALLLRISTRWDGPINEGWVTEAVWPPAVAEFRTFFAAKKAA
jgi:hypothetical protein